MKHPVSVAGLLYGVMGLHEIILDASVSPKVFRSSKKPVHYSAPHSALGSLVLPSRVG